MNNIHRLFKGTREDYLHISFPNADTLYFTTDSHELFLGSSKIGSGFLYIDDEHPRPEEGVPGYIYIDRESFDMWIWNENRQIWMYIGSAGDHNVSVHEYTEFKDFILNKSIDMASIIAVINLMDLPEEGKEDTLYFVKENSCLYLWYNNNYVMVSGNGEVNTDEADHSKTTDKLKTPVNINLAGDAVGSAAFDGSTDITINTTLKNTGTSEGTFNNDPESVTPITVDLKGRITGIGEKVPIAVSWESITKKPTTLEGFGITDAVSSDPEKYGRLILDCGDSTEEE